MGWTAVHLLALDVITDYTIRDIDGTIIALLRRTDMPDGKHFAWMTPDGVPGLPDDVRPNDMLYGLEHLRDGDEWPIFIVEGAKVADAMRAAGHIALGTVNGASATPSDKVLSHLAGRRVYLWPDNDDVGRAHMKRIADRLNKLDARVYMVPCTDGDDGADAADIDTDTIGSYIAHAVPVVQQHTGPYLMRANDLLMAWEIESQRAKQNERRTLSWSFKQLDEITDGLQPGLICIHAAPGAGKSALALQIATAVNAPVLYLTCEMSVREVLRRVVAHTSGVQKRDLLNSHYTHEEEMKLAQDFMRMASHMSVVDGSADGIKPQWLSNQIALLRKGDPDGHALLIIDSLHSWTLNLMMDGTTEYEGLNDAIQRLREIAVEHSVPVIMIAERNRQSMKDGGLSAVAGSRAAEYRSDVVVSLEISKPDYAGQPIDVEARVLKNRWGSPSMIASLSFDGDTQTFSEVGV